ncbi:MAG: DUF1156 domain-containing protein [Trueperaceae bacterium]|nr:DUF1156 domain-containing protein [Trueperaceae bacterium]
MTTRPRVLIEDWLPVKALGIESRRESAPIPGQFPKLKTLHVWWARRPLAASAGAVLGSVMPAWSESLAESYPEEERLASRDAYHAWFHRLCGILGDPVSASEATKAAIERGERIANPYTYKQAFKNSPETTDLDVLHRILTSTWGAMPSLIDPTAGGGSIPFEATRYGISTTANDLNPVASAVLRAGVATPSKHGPELRANLERWGSILTERITTAMQWFFPTVHEGELAATFLFARSIACPRTGKPVPLAPNWWLRKDKGGVAVRLVTERNGRPLDDPEFEIVTGKDIDFDPDDGTVAHGTGVSPWDGLAIDGDYIKKEAQEGRMGSILYAVATRTGKRRGFRAPTRTDLDALAAAEATLEDKLPEWLASDVIPREAVPEGNDSRPHQYGMSYWRDMFSPRQLLVHGTFVEEFRKLIPEVRSEVDDDDRANAILALLTMMQGKALNYNSRMSVWHPTRNSMANTFDRHDFSFKWTHGEFEGARELYPWTLSQLLDAYEGIAALLPPSDEGSSYAVELEHPVPGPIDTRQGNAANLDGIPDGSQHAIVVDPPYYDNVMYAELSDYFYVWEKRTLGLIWPEFFEDDLADKKNEAVANPARFKSAGRRKNELATADYEAKMTAIFEEAHRVLHDDGVLTVMFTHKKAEAWDTLGTSLMDAGFTIETSWPVPTESENSLHQAKKNAAQSTIFLVCRKRQARGDDVTFFDDIESDVRHAARDALARFTEFGIDGVDLLLSTYGPALSVISSHWPVYSSEIDPDTGDNRRLKPEEALDAAREELVTLQRSRLIGRAANLDAYTDFTLLAWETFKAREFPYDEARRLALAVGGLDVDILTKAKLLTKKSGSVTLLEPHQRVRRRGEANAALPGVHLDADAFEHVIDAVHTALYVTRQDGGATARDWLERRGLAKDARFLATVQGLVNAIPRTKKQGAWVVPEAGALDELAVFLEGIDVPEAHEPRESEQGGIDFGEGGSVA